MNYHIAFAGILILMSYLPVQVLAQIAYPEGMLTYQADTIRRLESHPASYTVQKLVVYQKGDFTRFELWRVNRYNAADYSKDIYIRNKTGTYTWIEESDAAKAAVSNFALFASYEEEKQHQARLALAHQKNIYQVKKVIMSVSWLDLPSERIMVNSGSSSETTEVIVTNAIKVPMETLFISLQNLPGTPLQFTDADRGWMTRFTAANFTSQSVPDRLFEADPARKLITIKDMRQILADF